ncbi:MAG: hypothetical protein M1839_004135 [Geoglossum umbratile]|nr:MAG: hypothetical protein M1839_004135 [Geoglossum umbratile]
MTSLRANTKDYLPSKSTRPLAIRDNRSSIPCHFFGKGGCRNGESCPYSHATKEESSTSWSNIQKAPVRVQRPLVGPNARTISGAVVHFSAEITVLSVKLPSDYSAIQITQLPLTATPDKITKLLVRSGFSIPDVRVRLVDGFVIAEARAEDPSFAERAIKNLNGAFYEKKRITVRRLQSKVEHGVSMSQFQNTSVICSWYKASRVAWAHYSTLRDAQKFARTMNGKNFMGRTLQCRVQPGTDAVRGATHSVQIGNLPSFASESALQHTFKHAQNVVLGPLSWNKPDRDAPNYIKFLLSQSGSLESFEVSPVTHPVRIKAIARFSSAEDARKVTKDLNGTNLPELGRSKLFLTPHVVFKFNVLLDMYEAIQGELDDLKPLIWNDGHVNLTAYPPTENAAKRFTTLRVTGGDVKSVAKAKGQVETILAGTLAVMSGKTTALWNDFFTTAEGLQFLNEQRGVYGVFLYRDSRKHQIRLYGPEMGKDKAQAALQQKVKLLSAQTHAVALDPGWLSNALQGGIRSIVSILGKGAARLDIMRKVLTVYGDQDARKTAERILEDPRLNIAAPEPGTSQDEKECSVCYTEPTEPYQTPCEHYYCIDCFAHQITSATRPEDFPITCLGSQGQCNQPIPFDELKRVLPPPSFESLLHSAFQAYIRANPSEFQYCPTADCDQLYRASSHDSDSGITFDCPDCLNTTCIRCKVTNHEGSTCAEYRELTSEGAIAFQKWKEKNHVKPCPKCGTPIEKESGCNHMTCTVCQAHICWYCMKVFGSGGECYTHMQGAHEDFF